MPVREGGNAAYMKVDNWWEDARNATPCEAFVEQSTSFVGLCRPRYRSMNVRRLSNIVEEAGRLRELAV